MRVESHVTRRMLDMKLDGYRSRGRYNDMSKKGNRRIHGIYVQWYIATYYIPPCYRIAVLV